MPDYPKLEGMTYEEAVVALNGTKFEFQAAAIIEYSLPFENQAVRERARLAAAMAEGTKWGALMRDSLEAFDRELERKRAGRRRKQQPRVGHSFKDAFGVTYLEAFELPTIDQPEPQLPARPSEGAEPEQTPAEGAGSLTAGAPPPTTDDPIGTSAERADDT